MFNSHKFLSMLTLVTLFFSLSACGEKSAKKKLAKNQFSMSDAFAVDGSAKEEGERVRISIAKEFLDSEFLLQTHVTVMPFLGTSWGMKSRVVTFMKDGKSLVMLEALEGNVVTDNIEQEFILAKFPIVRETIKSIEFDFNAGMTKQFTAYDWYSSDRAQGSNPIYRSNASEVELSYLKSAKSNDKNQLILKQVAQISELVATGTGYDSKGINQNLITIESTYYLAPYNPNPDFKIATNSGFDNMGFFEVDPTYNKGKGQVLATKFGPGEIVFALSPNTPEDYKQAVSDGILYWNKALKEDRIKVSEESATAPSFDYHVVQWIEWDDSGFAYADAQNDPRTGEILHAQVYLTSVFAISSKKSAVDFLKKIDAATAAGEASKTHDPFRYGLAGMTGKPMCNMKLHQKFAQTLRQALEITSDDKKIMQISQDYVRETVAHEVGHTMGLRHNFAGNLYTNINPAKKMKVFKKYVELGKTPEGVITSSSVMEYEAFIPSVLSGNLTATGKKALVYDENAIQKLYYGKDSDSEMLFCTDSHINTFVDCNVWDEGISIVASLAVSASEAQELLTNTIDLADMKIPLAYVIDTKAAAGAILRDSRAAIGLFAADSRTLAATRGGIPLPSLDFLSIDAGFDAINSDIEAYGGIEALFPVLGIKLPDAPAPIFEEVKENLQEALVLEMAKILNSSDTVTDSALSEKLSTYMLKFAEHVISSVNEEALEVSVPILDKPTPLPPSGSTTEPKDAVNTDKVMVIKELSLPIFKYSLSTRLEAMKLLKLGRGEAVNFMYQEQATALKNINAVYKAALAGQDISEVDISEWSEVAQKWVLENLEVLDVLDK
jgi:hypothetical protein